MSQYNKNKYSISGIMLLSFLLSCFLTSCEKENLVYRDIPVPVSTIDNAPVLKYKGMENLSKTGVTLYASIDWKSWDWRSANNNVGFLISSNPNPNIDGCFFTAYDEDIKANSFVVDISGLMPNQKYYFTPYADSYEEGITIYAEQIDSFITPDGYLPGDPYMKLRSPITVNGTSIMCTADIDWDTWNEYQKEGITVGVIVSENANLATDGTFYPAKEFDIKKDYFEVNIENLKPMTHYYVTPYANDNILQYMVYGNSVKITTGK